MKKRRFFAIYAVEKTNKTCATSGGVLVLLLSNRAAPFYVGWSGSGGGGCSNASNALYADSDDIKIYNT